MMLYLHAVPIQTRLSHHCDCDWSGPAANHEARAGTKLQGLYTPLSYQFVIMVKLMQWLSGKMTCFHVAEQGSSLDVVNAHLVFLGLARLGPISQGPDPGSS